MPQATGTVASRSIPHPTSRRGDHPLRQALILYWMEVFYFLVAQKGKCPDGVILPRGSEVEQRQFTE